MHHATCDVGVCGDEATARGWGGELTGVVLTVDCDGDAASRDRVVKPTRLASVPARGQAEERALHVCDVSALLGLWPQAVVESCARPAEHILRLARERHVGGVQGDEGPAKPLTRARSTLLTAVAKRDRKSTRLNSSLEWISYAVFCLNLTPLSDLQLGLFLM